jgi:type VI secretion system protein ImpH
MIPQALKNTFEKEPYLFEFVQLTRLFYLYQDGNGALHNQLVGYENSPSEEIVRFKSTTSMRHRSSDITKIESLDDGRFCVMVSFLGLIGAAGVLPHHYSQMVINREKANDHAMRDFFDLFHHRIISNFFRASVKYRLPFQHELYSRFKLNRHGSGATKAIEKDAVTRCISCTVGLGETPIQNRLAIDDRNLLFYAGNYSHSRPTMTGLTRMLTEFTGMNVKLLQFQFEWLYLDPTDQTDLSNPRKRLGYNVVIGSRVGSIQNRFRIRLGPLHWRQFLELLPNRRRLKEIAAFARAYVGIALDFDFQLVLLGSEVPCMQLGSEESGLLGWNTWITASKLDGEIEDAIIDMDKIESSLNPA